ncbi:hypothetical protein MHD_10680 [Mannheimia granulomatis]|uniref:Uncharacterized protein n=1 Tax=Mannheimia granulomatis TaxID=85402 RepID=A0A011N9Q8_9PAST|nr:hypothetical protein AK33_11070 [Mannheimia granulomatis]RGE47245.1 hypothetical protein MHD_10680 [Mannheimia granulomatis]
MFKRKRLCKKIYKIDRLSLNAAYYKTKKFELLHIFAIWLFIGKEKFFMISSKRFDD